MNQTTLAFFMSLKLKVSLPICSLENVYTPIERCMEKLSNYHRKVVEYHFVHFVGREGWAFTLVWWLEVVDYEETIR